MHKKGDEKPVHARVYNKNILKLRMNAGRTRLQPPVM